VGAFTGDFIFAGDVGRPDLLERAAGISGTMEAGARQLYASLQRFSAQPDRLLLWPGHGSGSACGKKLGGMPVTALGYEKLANWAFQAKDESEFVSKVLEDQPEPPRYFAEMKRVNKIGASAIWQAPAQLDPGAMESMLSSGSVQVIDLRPAADFAAGFIPGTITIPLDKNFLNWCGALLGAKEELCLLGEEMQVREATAALGLIGLDCRTGWFAPSVLDLWRARHGRLAVIDQLEAAQWNESRPEQQAVLDVRAATEYRAGHIPGAVHIPLGHLPEAARQLPKEFPLLVHCQGGVRSPIALSLLVKMGFCNLTNLSGGFQEYQRQGLPVEIGGN
jgi:hydroxyacylglutathione hydrolase